MTKPHAIAWVRCLSALLLVMSVIIGHANAQSYKQTAITKSVNYAIGGYMESLPPDYSTNTTKKYPLLIFIHGIGEVGTGSQTDLQKLLRNGPTKLVSTGAMPSSFTVNGETFSFIIISPQFRGNYRDQAAVSTLIDYCVKNYNVDESRIYLTGLSMGGGISWIYAGASVANAKRIAALLDVCGNTNAFASGANNMVAASLPVWITHNTGDNIVSPYNSINWEKALNGHEPPINPKTIFNLFNADGHNAWTLTYSLNFKPDGLNVYEWMLTHKRGSTTTSLPPANKAPIVSAGTDVQIYLPDTMVTLEGKANDADGKIVSHEWTKVSGPADGDITFPENIVTTALPLVEGVYVFRLTAKDDDGAVTSDDVTVTVGPSNNIDPVAEAGADVTITLPADSVELFGKASDSDGSIKHTAWEKVSGPDDEGIDETDSLHTWARNLKEGTYVFRFTATDNKGASASDEIEVKVLAEALVNANAGKDTIIFKNQTQPDTVYLNGNLSEGGSQYVWRRVSGPGKAMVEDSASLNTMVTGLSTGEHIFQLTIDGQWSDNVTVRVRDWQQKGISPCRPGGGKTFVVPESSPGKYEYPYINRDNVLGERVMGGDILLFPGGKKTAFEIGDFGGAPGCPVVVMPKDEALVVTGGFFRIGTRDSNVVQHVVLDGTRLRSKGIPYGFFVDNRGMEPGQVTYSALAAKWVANFTVKGYRSINTGVMMIKLDAQTAPYGRYDKFVQKNIRIIDNYIDGSIAEGLYIGHSAPNGGQLGNLYGPPPRMDSVEISHNIVTNCAWDGIQLSSARSGAIIRHNFVYKTGTANQPQQRAGILMGANTTGIVDSNIVINSKGIGIQVFGYGAVKVQGNVIDSIAAGSGDQDGIYESFLTVQPERDNIALSSNNIGNLISRVERHYVRVANNSGEMQPGNTLENFLIYKGSKTVADLIAANALDVLQNNEILEDFPLLVKPLAMQQGKAHIALQQGDGDAAFDNIPETVRWIFSRLKKATTPNKLPIANAGNDMMIQLPVDSIELNGSGADVDGTITAYEWKQLSGNAVTFSKPHAAATNIQSFATGTYTFELKVTDNSGATARDTVQLTVKAAPVIVENKIPEVFAGNNVRITLPKNSIILNGTATDADGKITAIQWTEINTSQSHISDATSLQTKVVALKEGEYRFVLRATDNDGAFGTDTVKVTVLAAAVVVPENKLPVVYAGADQKIQLPTDSVRLSGMASDKDGTIENYRWTLIKGASTVAIDNANTATTLVGGLHAGSYMFELAATDNAAAIVKDTVIITVMPKLNLKPLANAGADVKIQLPENTVVLNGKAADADGLIASYKWRQVSGSKAFATANTPLVTVKNLSAGVYIFEFSVTDNDGGIASDTVKVEVLKAAVKKNIAPVALAGADIKIQLPQNKVTLHGAALDADGTIVNYSWKQLQGPAASKLETPGQIKTNVSGLIKGEYLFTFSVKDNEDALHSDTVKVMVAAAPKPAPNKSPIVSAGNDIAITLPINKTVLSGEGLDADGSIAKYEWKKIAGPAQFIIASPAKRTTDVINLVKGVYKFELRVTDNKGAASADTVQVTVHAAATRPMFELNAGDDITVWLPEDSVVLSAMIDDPYGTVKKWNWKKIKGPKNGIIRSATEQETIVSSLEEGVYDFVCMATDENGNKLVDTVQVIVKVLPQSTAAIFPNPSTGMVNIKIESNTEASNTEIMVFDIMGRIAYKETFLRTESRMVKTINLSRLPAGVYTFIIMTDINTKTSVKWIKQ